MTIIKTRAEMSSEFKNVKYILTSSMRTRLLLAIYNDSKNLDDLRQNMDLINKLWRCCYTRV